MPDTKSFRSHDMTPKQLRETAAAFRTAMQNVLDGNLSELARRCRVTPQAVQSWTASGAIPARRVAQVCNALNNHVSDYELRPDIFRDPAK